MKRWSSRRLLYPLAIFAIIAPTVVMGLFGAYALSEIELRPSAYRAELNEERDKLQMQLEQRVSQLRLQPPASDTELDRLSGEVREYFADYNRAFASRCYFGRNGRVMRSYSLDGKDDLPVPPVLSEMVANIAASPPAGLTRQAFTLPGFARSQRQSATFVMWLDGENNGFIVWELINSQVDKLISNHLGQIKLADDALMIESADRSQLESSQSMDRRYEILHFIPVHSELVPDRYLVMKLNVDRQFAKDNRLLSTIFMVIAVLCVPIVASATLMVVHLILREASEARKKVDFVSNVTHELKTPLTSIRMFVETLKLGRAKSQEQMTACLDVIMTETDRLGALIDHVLSFSKVENQVKKYNFQQANLPTVVRDTISLFRAQMSGTDGEIRLKILPGVPSQASFDKDAIREVLLNLLSNAIKYSGDDKFVTVMVGIDRNDLFIEVADRGIGIPAEDQSRIFDKFYRVDQALSRKVDGTGLGLAICKEIVQAHGGRITLESVWGKGSRFTVYIPYKRGNSRKPTNTRLRPSTRETKVASGETNV